MWLDVLTGQMDISVHPKSRLCVSAALVQIKQGFFLFAEEREAVLVPGSERWAEPVKQAPVIHSGIKRSKLSLTGRTSAQVFWFSSLICWINKVFIIEHVVKTKNHCCPSLLLDRLVWTHSELLDFNCAVNVYEWVLFKNERRVFSLSSLFLLNV